ncbi:MAG: hypothetical protein A2138_19765 [Deltaproteobacteria bacterium RBG_16_71_12]|nr:MAG: hypothetical protein A2138_19765 [Deltaproteobacteria bacterium RBG_16_71_12]
MTPELRYAKRAVRQIAAAASWWTENRPLAPMMFERELAHALRTIQESSTVFAELKTTKAKGIRRVLMARSRYHLYWHMIEDGTVVEILACWHTSRGRNPPLR